MFTKFDRELAIRAVRSKMRASGIAPERQPAKNALATLDDIARSNPDLAVSKWYLIVPDRQIVLFVNEWNAWRTSVLKDDRIASQVQLLPGVTDTSPAVSNAAQSTENDLSNCGRQIDETAYARGDETAEPRPKNA